MDLELIWMDFATPDKGGLELIWMDFVDPKKNEFSRELIWMDFAAPDKGGFRTNTDEFCSS